MTIFVIFICILSLYFLHDDVSDVVLDWSDRRESVRRASVVLIWIICLVQRRRLFRGAVFPGFIHICAPRQLPVLMVGGLMSTSCVFALRCGKAFMMRCCDSNPKPHDLWLTPEQTPSDSIFRIYILHVLIFECVVESLTSPTPPAHTSRSLFCALCLHANGSQRFLTLKGHWSIWNGTERANLMAVVDSLSVRAPQ